MFIFNGILNRLKLNKGYLNKLKVFQSQIGVFVNYVLSLFLDYIVTNEIISKTLSKSIIDRISIQQEKIEKRVYKYAVEELENSESIKLLFTKNTLENNESSELIEKEITKLLSDNNTTSDNIRIIMQYYRNYFDFALATDLTKKTIEKNISENLSVTDIFDIVLLIIGKSFTDNVELLDSFRINYTKILDDQNITSEKIEKTTEKTFGDFLDGFDVFRKQTQKIVSEDNLLDDIFNKEITKINTELIGLNDLFYRVVEAARYFSENNEVSDIFSIIQNKTFSERQGILSLFYKEFLKINTEYQQSLDSGKLLNQDYCSSPDYFSDDYTGDKRLF